MPTLLSSKVTRKIKVVWLIAFIVVGTHLLRAANDNHTSVYFSWLTKTTISQKREDIYKLTPISEKNQDIKIDPYTFLKKDLYQALRSQWEDIYKQQTIITLIDQSTQQSLVWSVAKSKILDHTQLLNLSLKDELKKPHQKKKITIVAVSHLSVEEKWGVKDQLFGIYCYEDESLKKFYLNQRTACLLNYLNEQKEYELLMDSESIIITQLFSFQEKGNLAAVVERVYHGNGQKIDRNIGKVVPIHTKKYNPDNYSGIRNYDFFIIDKENRKVTKEKSKSGTKQFYKIVKLEPDFNYFYKQYYCRGFRLMLFAYHAIWDNENNKEDRDCITLPFKYKPKSNSQSLTKNFQLNIRNQKKAKIANCSYAHRLEFVIKEDLEQHCNTDPFFAPSPDQKRTILALPKGIKNQVLTIKQKEPFYTIQQIGQMSTLYYADKLLDETKKIKSLPKKKREFYFQTSTDYLNTISIKRKEIAVHYYKYNKQDQLLALQASETIALASRIRKSAQQNITKQQKNQVKETTRTSLTIPSSTIIASQHDLEEDSHDSFDRPSTPHQLHSSHIKNEKEQSQELREYPEHGPLPTVTNSDSTQVTLGNTKVSDPSQTQVDSSLSHTIYESKITLSDAQLLKSVEEVTTLSSENLLSSQKNNLANTTPLSQQENSQKLEEESFNNSRVRNFTPSTQEYLIQPAISSEKEYLQGKAHNNQSIPVQKGGVLLVFFLSIWGISSFFYTQYSHKDKDTSHQ